MVQNVKLICLNGCYRSYFLANILSLNLENFFKVEQLQIDGAIIEPTSVWLRRCLHSCPLQIPGQPSDNSRGTLFYFTLVGPIPTLVMDTDCFAKMLGFGFSVTHSRAQKCTCFRLWNGPKV